VKKPKFGVVVFPGSNCDHDCYHVLKHVLRQDVDFIWHRRQDLREYDVVILPGGFSYGDYLRTGAIARFSPVMRGVVEAGRHGKSILGICNGFQILCEAGLLPGALLRNESLRFVCRSVHIRTEKCETRFTNECRPGEILKVPVAHGDGLFYADQVTLSELEANGQVVFRYCDAGGDAVADTNPNGSLNHIAGVINLAGNVLGMMPHPERNSEPELGDASGRKIFDSLLTWCAQ